MKSLVFSLACFLLAGCAGPTNSGMDAHADTASRSGEVDTGAAPLQSIHEIRETDGGRKVGMVYQRDHGRGRSIYWVYDGEGNRRGFITEHNRAYAYEYALGKRTDTLVPLGSDTITSSARKIIGSDRAVKLVQIDIDTWAGTGK